MAIRTYEQLVKEIGSRANTKLASTKSAAGDTPSEKDPAEKGTAAIPKDPNATPAAENLPANSTNADVTPVVSISPAKTVGSEEKVASSPLLVKAQAVAAGIQGLLKKSTASEITPNLVSDKGSDNKDTAPAPSTSNAPAKHQNPDPVTKDAAPAPDAKDPTCKTVAMPSTDSKGDLPPDAKNTNDVTTKKSEEGCMTDGKSAADTSLEFDPTFHYKLASLILATEDGRAFARSIIEQAHGAAEAEDIIKAAAYMEEQANHLADLEAQGAFMAEDMWNNATPEERENIIKLANVHALAKAGLKTDLEKQAYDDGAATGAGLMDSGVIGADGGAGGPPSGDPSAPAGGDGSENITDDDIVAVLTELVQSGQIKPEEAEAIMQELQKVQGGGADGTPPGGAPDPSGAGAPEAPAPAGGSPEEKEASATVKSASAAADLILAEINKPVPAAPK